MIFRIILLLLIPSFLFSQSQPNIIFIMADDLGYHELGTTGSVTYSTPAIDSLRNGGAFFRRFYTAPICTPTRGMLATSKYAHKLHFQTSVIWPGEDRGLSADETTIAERLKGEGYATALFGKWHLGHAYPEQLPHARGFDLFRGFAIGGITYDDKKGSCCGVTDSKDYQRNGVFEDSDTYLTTDIQNEAVSWIGQQAADSTQPFFAFLSLYAPHTPTTRNKVNSIQTIDTLVSAVWAKVRSEGIENKTIIMFCSDNGTYDAADATNPFKLYKGFVTEGGIRSPLIWYHKNTVVAGTMIDSVTSVIDFGPTWVDIAGGIIPEKDSVDGQSFASLLGYSNSESWTANRKYIAHYIPGRLWAVIQGDYKLINNEGYSMRYDSARTESLTMYNVEVDSAETTNIISSNTALRDSMRTVIDNISGVSNYEWLNNAFPPGWVDPVIFAITKWFYSSDNVYNRQLPLFLLFWWRKKKKNEYY